MFEVVKIPLGININTIRVLYLLPPDGVSKSAVLVIIPGESYTWGGSSLYDCTVLADRGRLIVVTLNYRLGILGEFRTIYP